MINRIARALFAVALFWAPLGAFAHEAAGEPGMQKFTIDKAAGETVKDLHRGIHQAMDALIRRKNSGEAERILRMVDDRMTALLNQSKVV